MSEIFIKKEELNKIKGINSELNSIAESIGVFEVQKQILVSRCIGIGADIEKLAKAAMINAGIEESKLSNYTVSLENGKIVEKK